MVFKGGDNINNISNRLKKIRQSLNLTLKAFGENIGLSTSAYSDIEKGRNNLTERNKNLICQVFNVNPEWLETGKEPMFLQSDKDLLDDVAKKYNLDDVGKRIILAYSALSEHERIVVKKFIQSILKENDRVENIAITTKDEDNEPEKSEETYIDYFYEKVSAGSGFDLFGSNPEKIGLKLNKLTARTDFAVTVDGDSMLPKFKDGDTLLVHSQPDVEIGEIGIFVLNNKGFVKKRGKDKLISLNKDYPDINIPYGETSKCCGKVIGILDPAWRI